MVKSLEPHNAAWIETALTAGSLTKNILSLLSVEERKLRLANARNVVKESLLIAAMRKKWSKAIACVGARDSDVR